MRDVKLHKKLLYGTKRMVFMCLQVLWNKDIYFALLQRAGLEE